MGKLNVGVIGVGHLGKLHAKMFTQIANCNLAGVFDLNFTEAEKTADEFKTTAFHSIDELLEKVNAVSIAATTSAHYEVAKKCFEKNIHVFVEKPITAAIEQGEELVKIAKEKNLKFQIGHIERFNPGLLSLESFISDPMFIQSDRLSQFNPRGTDVAVVLDLMIHDIDIILSFIKSEVKQIDANGVAVVSDHIDIANARIQFENGAVANVTASRISQKKMRKMRIFQKDHYISLDFVTGASEIYRLLPIDQPALPSSVSFGEIGVGDKKKRLIYEQPEIKEVNALKYELQLFADAVLNNKKIIVTGEDGLRALKVAEIIIQKIEQSKGN
ncbi:MAG: Gfo/Idh/MocA family oxidoreductase [Ignavibacteriaceae bacterium]|jgi:predicted dehydrogenase|nr:Gfo/Idh/MocA family oxidoreductase [Ignavibacteriaceae bacterium]